MVGLIGRENDITTQWFKQAGDRILLIGETREDIGGTEYLKIIHSREQGMPPYLDVEQEQAVQHCVLHLIQKGWVESAHDCSEGGLLVTLAECCFTHPLPSLGATISLNQERLRLDALLFGESPSRIVISVKEENLQHVTQFIQDLGTKVPMSVLGQVTDSDQMAVTVQGEQEKQVQHFSWSVKDLADRWQNCLAQQLDADPSRHKDIVLHETEIYEHFLARTE